MHIPKVVKSVLKCEPIAEMKENTSFELELAGTNKVSEEKGLSTFQDMEEETETVFLDCVPPPAVLNPYPDQTPAAILSRWYQVGTFIFTKTTPVNASLFPVYSLLASQPAISNALYTFRYLKWKFIEVRLQTSTMPQIYGWFGFSSFPPNLMPDGHPNDGQVVNDHLKLLSFNDTVLFDFSVQNDVVVQIPWRHPEQWVDWRLNNAGGNQVDALVAPTVFNDVNPVKVLQSTATPSVNCVLFARFVDPEVAGPTDTPATYFGQSKFVGSDILFDGESFRAHDDVVLRGPKSKTLNPGFGSQTQSKASVVNKKDEENEPELRNNPVGSLVSSCSRYVCGSGTQIAPTRDYKISDYISVPTCIGKVVPSNTIGSQTSPIYPMVRYSTVHTWTSLGDYSRLVYMSQFFRMWRGSIDYTFVFFSTPFLSARYNILVDWSSGTSSSKVGNEIIQDVTVRGTTVVHVSVPFLYGGQWAPCPYQVPDSYYLSGGDATPRPRVALYTITPPVSVGDVAATIPVLVFERAGPDFEFRSLVNPSPQLLPTIPGLEDEFVYEGQMRVSEMCVSAVSGGGGLPPLPNSAPSEMSIGEMVRRWGSRRSVPAEPQWADQQPLPMKWNNNDSAPILDHLSWIFGFWSGQIKMKMFLPVGTANDQYCWHTTSYIGPSIAGGLGNAQCDRPEDGMSAGFSTLTKVLESTAPFLCTTPILPVICAPPVTTIGYTSFSVTDQLRIWWNGYLHDDSDTYTNADFFYIAAGDDFCFYFPLPPPFIGRFLWPSYGCEPSTFPSSLVRKNGKQKLKEQSSSKSCISTTTTTSSESMCQ